MLSVFDLVESGSLVISLAKGLLGVKVSHFFQDFEHFVKG